MGTSFVSINDKGFWMRDGVLELWLRLLALHVEEPTREEGVVQRDIRDKWLLASRGFFNGCIPDDLEEIVSTDGGREVAIQAIHSLLGRLKEGRKELDAGTLNLLGIEGSWNGNFEAWRLIEVGNAFLALIAGRIQSDASSTEFMPGCREKSSE